MGSPDGRVPRKNTGNLTPRRGEVDSQDGHRGRRGGLGGQFWSRFAARTFCKWSGVSALAFALAFLERERAFPGLGAYRLNLGSSPGFPIWEPGRGGESVNFGAGWQPGFSENGQASPR